MNKIHSSLPKLNIIGAFDRFNFGDVLFVHILKNKLAHFIENYEFQYISTSSTNLVPKGGFQTHSMQTMFSNSPAKSIYLIAGGEVLAAPWWYMYLCLVDTKKLQEEESNFIKMGLDAANDFARSYFHCKHFYPWVLERKDFFQKKALLIYNAIGGSSLKKLDDETRKQLTKTLMSSDYISVRDVESKNILIESGFASNEVDVYPDCGVLISDIFTKDTVKGKISLAAKDFVNQHPNYIIFQSGKYHVMNQNSTDTIVEQLVLIASNENTTILLLPFSDAAFHEDHLILQEIYTKANHPNIKIHQTVNFFDITYFMMHAKLFMGTSLHGNIVSFSYGIPSVGLTFLDKKLPEFIKTWIKDDAKLCYEFNEMHEAYKSNIKYNKTHYIERSKRAIAKAQENIDNISDIILKKINSLTFMEKIKKSFKLIF